MKAAALTLTAAGVLLLSASSARASIEAGEGAAPTFDFINLYDRAETLMNQITEQPATVDIDTASRNIAAWLKVIPHAEGTASRVDPYRVCYGYSHTIRDLREHPAITGEWRGQTLSDRMCSLAGFGPGCISSAAGAYQIIKPTWINVRDALGLRDFGQASQDAAAIELTRRRGALEDVKAGRLALAVSKCRNEWASLPGNYAKQGQRSIETLAGWYEQNGGTFA